MGYPIWICSILYSKIICIDIDNMIICTFKTIIIKCKHANDKKVNSFYYFHLKIVIFKYTIIFIIIFYIRAY